MNRTNYVLWVLLEDHFVDITEMVDPGNELGHRLWWGKPPPYESAFIGVHPSASLRTASGVTDSSFVGSVLFVVRHFESPDGQRSCAILRASLWPDYDSRTPWHDDIIASHEEGH